MPEIKRQTVDLSGYPNLVVIYLGMRVNRLGGLRSILRLGPAIQKSVDAKPDGLLCHEPVFYSLFPLHIGMRQYWRDFESLEKWTRSMPHSAWWKDFVKGPSGVAFWHETYFMRGGFEAIYDELPDPLGFLKFAPHAKAEGAMFSARRRLKLQEEADPDVS